MTAMESLVVSVTLGLVQEGGPTGAPQPAGPSVPGQPGTTGTPQQPLGTGGGGGGGGGFNPIFALLLVMVVFILMTTMAGRKEKRRRAALLAGVKRGDRVQTVGGEIGTIVDLTDTEMTLRVDEVTNTRIRFTRASIQQVLKEGKEADVKGKIEATPAR